MARLEPPPEPPNWPSFWRKWIAEELLPWLGRSQLTESETVMIHQTESGRQPLPIFPGQRQGKANMYRPFQIIGAMQGDPPEPKIWVTFGEVTDDWDGEWWPDGMDFVDRFYLGLGGLTEGYVYLRAALQDNGDGTPSGAITALTIHVAAETPADEALIGHQTLGYFLVTGIGAGASVEAVPWTTGSFHLAVCRSWFQVPPQFSIYWLGK